MAGFNPPVPQQDSNWEIRAAVMLSLLLQMILIFVGPRRKRSSSPIPRFAVWSCYLLADWIADLALGLLLNNMGNGGGNGGGGSSSISHPSGLKRGPVGGAANAGNSGGGNSSPIIFAFWTPFLLLHLGGPDTITAYSLQDNELWPRHLIGLLFELFSASYIFFSSRKGNNMIPATVLIFVVGIIKYGERTYSLYSGSVNGFRNNILGDPEPGPNYAKLMTEFDAKEKAGLAVEIVIANGEAKKAQDALEQDEIVRLVETSDKTVEAQAYEFFRIFRVLFVNLILSYKERKISQAYFLERPNMTARRAFEVIEVELNFIYDMVYTKAPVAHKRAGCVLRFVGSGCLVSALAIFVFRLHKDISIQRVDIGVTFALLLGGLVLDAAALVMHFSSDWTLVFLDENPQLEWLARAVRSLRPRKQRWSERTSQLNLISYCLGKPDGDYDEGGGHRRFRICYFASQRVLEWLVKVAAALHLISREVYDDFIFIRRQTLSVRWEDEPPLLRFFFEWIRTVATRSKNLPYQEMKRMLNSIGEGVLEETVLPKESKDVLEGSVRRDFDQSLLMWHIATDLCSCAHGSKATVWTRESGNLEHASKTLSEYMLYLLVKQPEMLSATAGIGLLRFRDTCSEARRFFESASVWDPDHADARRMLLSVNTSKTPSEVKGDRSKSVLFDACILAKVLRELDVETMWKVVAGVWVQMLTYAAGKCQGSTHVTQLSQGGELITLVWFLMAHMGLGDMYQIQEGDAKAKLIVHDQ